MARSTVEFDLGDVSSYRTAGSPKSYKIQRQLLDSFLETLHEELPEGASVGKTEPFDKSWRIYVLFNDRSTETNAYRRSIQGKFPHSLVSSARDGGDVWTLSYSSGIQSRTGRLGTCVLCCIVALVVYAVIKLKYWG